jgi:hypothetical protein
MNRGVTASGVSPLRLEEGVAGFGFAFERGHAAHVLRRVPQQGLQRVGAVGRQHFVEAHNDDRLQLVHTQRRVAAQREQIGGGAGDHAHGGEPKHTAGANGPGDRDHAYRGIGQQTACLIGGRHGLFDGGGDDEAHRGAGGAALPAALHTGAHGRGHRPQISGALKHDVLAPRRPWRRVFPFLLAHTHPISC